MLNVDTLESEIKKAFSETLPTAFEQAVRSTFPKDSKLGDEMAKQFGEIIDECVSESLAKRIAAAIDYYVKNAQIFGAIITTGGPFTQTAMVNSTSIPTTNGAIPNTLGIK